MIKGLHHNAYRCRDSEETRRFYEDFLGLPLAHTLEINETKTGRQAKLLHTFYELDDGSYLAFFEAPDQPFDFKERQDFAQVAPHPQPGDQGDHPLPPPGGGGMTHPLLWAEETTVERDVTSDEVRDARVGYDRFRCASAEELDRILGAHRRWLESEAREGRRADPSHADLQGADLSDRDLQKTDISGADVLKANLSAVTTTRVDARGVPESRFAA